MPHAKMVEVLNSNSNLPKVQFITDLFVSNIALPCGAFYGVGSCWFLKTEEGEIKLYAGDIVAKVGETVKDGVPQPVFAAYGMRRLKPE